MAGTTRVDGTLEASTVTIEGGSPGGTGTLIGSLSVNGPGAAASPGNSVGTLTLEGPYTQDAEGTLAIEIDASGSDVLDLTGFHASLAGTLSVTLLNGFTPSLNDIFVFLLAASIARQRVLHPFSASAACKRSIGIGARPTLSFYDSFLTEILRQELPPRP